MIRTNHPFVRMVLHEKHVKLNPGIGSSPKWVGEKASNWCLPLKKVFKGTQDVKKTYLNKGISCWLFLLDSTGHQRLEQWQWPGEARRSKASPGGIDQTAELGPVKSQCLRC